MKGLISSFIFCFLATSIYSQNSDRSAAWWNRMNDPTANYYEVVAEADSFFHNADSSEIFAAPVSLKRYGWWRYFWGTRLDVAGGTRLDAMQSQRDIFSGASTCNTNSSWEQLGPFEPVNGTSSGRGTGFVQETWVNPANQDEIFIGAEQGGVFKSTNGGDSWTDLLLSARLPSVQVTTMEVNPNNTDHIYVSVGDEGIGFSLVYSNDGGQTWGTTALSNTLAVNNQRLVVQKVEPHFGGFSVAYAFNADSVYATTNGFQSVEALPVGITDEDDQQRWISMEMNLSQNLFFSNEKQVFRWDHQTSTLTDLTLNIDTNQSNRVGDLEHPLIATDINNSNHVYLLFRYKNASNHYYVSLQKSTDNGQSFTQLCELLHHNNKPSRDDFQVSKTDAETFYFAGQYRPCRIKYSGSNWVLNKSFAPSSGAVDLVHDDVRDIDIIDNGDGTESIYWSTDGTMNKQVGSTFENLTAQNINLWMVVGFADVDATGEMFAGVWHGGTNLRKPDGSWRHFSEGDGGFAAIAAGDKRAVVTTNNSRLVRYNKVLDSQISTSINHPDTGLDANKYIVVPTVSVKSAAASFYMGYNDVYKLDWVSANWTNLTNRGRDIQAIEAPEAHPNTVAYIVRNKKFQEDSALFISPNNGAGWIEIPGVAGVDVLVNTLFIHPSDPDQIWVGMAGYVNQKKVYVTYDGGQNWTNVSEPILGIQHINDFAHDPVTDILYMANDVGVFYRDLNAPSPEWKCFYKGLPSAHVLYLDINFCTKKILASSYGRGIWQADLVDAQEHTFPIPEFISSMIIDENEEYYPKGNIAVTGTMTVKGKVFMNEDAKIFVLPGARLYVDGGTLTNACGGLWGGVQTFGQNHASTANGYSYPQTDLTKHGFVELDGATIEHAHIAVQVGRDDAGNYEGGILRATNSEFYNNEVAIEMHPYKNRQAASPFAEIPNASYLRNCEFITDGVLDDGQVSEPIAQLELHGISGVRIQGCDFEDRTDWSSIDRSGLANYRVGIRSWDATYALDPTCGNQSLLYSTPCWNIAGADSNVFSGYKKAIEAINFNSTVPVLIRGVKFQSNYVNAVIWGADMAEIYRNDFHSEVIGNNNTAPSVYLLGSTGYTFEENNFIGTTEGSNRGLAVFDSGNDMNEIRSNRFEKLDISASLVGDNDGNGPYDGLQYLCNEIDETDIDVYVTGGDIGKYQGFCPVLPNNEAPANNEFSATCFGPSQYTLSGVNQQIVYSHLTGEEPTCISAGLLTNDCQFSYSVANGERCPLNDKIHPDVGNGLAHEIKTQLDDFKDWVTSSNDELQTLIASNASDQLVVSAIEDSLPIVSDSVLIYAMTMRPQPMEANHLLTILELNAPLSNQVMDVLNVEYPSLVQDLNDYVAQNSLVLSPLTQAELEANANERELKRLHEEIMRYWMAYDTTGGSSDSALAFLQSQSGDFYRLKEAKLQYYLGNKASANALLQNISADYLAPEVDAWSEIMDAIADDSMGVFRLETDSLLEAKVRALAAVNKETMEVVSARGMLNRVFDEPMALPTMPEPEGNAKNRSQAEQQFEAFSEAGMDRMTLFPNPATDRIVVEYHLDESVEDAILQVYSVEGKSLGKYALDPMENRKELDVSYLSKGIYVYLLTADGTFIARRKLMIHE